MHEVELITEGTRTRILLDGKEVYATKATFEYAVNCVPSVVLELPLKKAVVKTDQAYVVNQEGEPIE